MSEVEDAKSQEAGEEDELKLALEDKKEAALLPKEEEALLPDEDKKDKEEAKLPGEAEPPDLDPVEVLQEQVKDLRQMVRTSKRELTQTQAKLERLGERSASEDPKGDDDDIEDEDKKGKSKEKSLSTVEELQESISAIGATKGAALDVLLEAMEQNTKYEDIREVCSRENFDDIFEAIAAEVTKDGGDFNQTLLEVELSIWNKSNPYKYMYDLIKKHHPSYADKKAAAGPKDKKKDKAHTKADAPGTIADKGGDSNVKGGWTAKRIDDLPEDELHTVPKEIYDKYMKDELD